MIIHKLILVIIVYSVGANDDTICYNETALQFIKHSTFDFSIKLLQRVAADTDAHFVFSPLTIWLQITALSEGATGETFKEIWNVTRKHQNECFKKKLHQIIFELNIALKLGTHSKGNSVMAIDNSLAVKKKFIKIVQQLYGITVFLLDFDQQQNAADEVNRAFAEGSGGIINSIVYYDDFGPTKLILSDANSFQTVWQTEFYQRNTQPRPFYTNSGGEVGAVSMMQHTGFYYMVEFPQIGATVLELPLGIPGVSMLVFLNTDHTWIGDIFHSLEKTKLAALLKLLSADDQKLVNVFIPKFEQQTEIENLPELIADMGIRRIFTAGAAELKGISKYKIHASLMTQISRIKVNEKGVSDAIKFEFINDTGIDFNANRPFVYMVVDKKNELVIYAGAYSVPSEV